jgi:hypothetical protein
MSIPILNVNQLSKEIRLQLELLKTKNQVDILNLNREWFVHIDWNLFIELALHHRTYTLIYLKIKELQPDKVPEYVIKILYRYYVNNTFEMLSLSAEVESISKFLSKKDIRTIFLKGPVLAKDLYGEISLRTSCDIDVLVSLKDLTRAEDYLVELGYVKNDYFTTVLSDWKWRHHHVTYFHSEKNIKLELHWRLNPGPGIEPGFEDLWERKRKSSLTNFPVYLLGIEDLFLFLTTHGARHGWSRLRWLLDIQQMAKQSLNWRPIIALLKKYKCQHIGSQALVLVYELLGSFPPDSCTALLQNHRGRKLAQEAMFYLKDMINLHSHPLPKHINDYHKKHLYSLKSIKEKFLFLLSLLHPYPDDVMLLPLPKYLEFLYIPLRPFIWAWRKTVKQV